MHKYAPVPNAQQKRLAELLVIGDLSVVDAYAEAYKQTKEQLEDRQKLASRAYMASKSKGCLYWIEKLQQQQAVQEARILVWDKRSGQQVVKNVPRDRGKCRYNA